jgi:NAD(P)H dehydrogenase (quinone)
MFLVTGASGSLFGRPVLDQLRRLVPAGQIVAGTRDPATASALRAAGFDVRRVDFVRARLRRRDRCPDQRHQLRHAS